MTFIKNHIGEYAASYGAVNHDGRGKYVKRESNNALTITEWLYDDQTTGPSITLQSGASQALQVYTLLVRLTQNYRSISTYPYQTDPRVVVDIAAVSAALGFDITPRLADILGRNLARTPKNVDYYAEVPSHVRSNPALYGDLYGAEPVKVRDGLAILHLDTDNPVYVAATATPFNAASLQSAWVA